MRLEFRVDGLPPKKDGANSIWRKPGELEKIRQLRLRALQSLSGSPPLNRSIRLQLIVHIGPANHRRIGDLDNFITGVCDALQSAHPRTPLDNWLDDTVQPGNCIAIQDDVEILQITASKVVGDEAQFYDVILEGEHA
jgi:hypothetical protein